MDIYLGMPAITPRYPRLADAELEARLGVFDSREDLRRVVPVQPQAGWRLRHEDFGALAFNASTGELIRLDDDAAIADFVADHSPTQVLTGSTLANSLRAPVKLFLDITKVCNQQCEHCLSSSGRSTETMPEKMVLSILDQAYDLGVFQVKFGGGEPLLHPRFFSLVNHANELSMRVSISTNGTVITERRAELIKAAGVKVSVSIDGDQSVHDQIRGKNAYTGALRGIERLIKHSVRPGLRMTIFNHPEVNNLHLVKNVVELGQRYGLGVRLRRAKPAGRATDGDLPLAFPTEDYWSLLEWLEEARSQGAEVDVEDLMCLSGDGSEKLFPTTFDCAAGTRSIHVDVYGDISPCVFLGPDYASGNVFSSPLNEIWYSGHGFQSARDYTTMANSDCSSCERKSLCSGECRAIVFYAQAATGQAMDGGGKDPCCPKEQRVYEFSETESGRWRPVQVGHRSGRAEA